MCGIFSYIGEKEIISTLLSGLKRLEYRGYDSAGISVFDNNKIITIKEKGKISSLAGIIGGYSISSTCGISHTRWATHGEPNKINAHPHTDQKENISIVHNGIIENYLVLRRELEKEGIVFKSETDSEVIAQLIGKHYSGNLEKAVKKSLIDLEGTYGIAVICKNEPDKIIGARKGSPLIAGIGQNESFLASDVSPIVPHTREVIYLEDNDVIVLEKNSHRIFNMAAASVKKEITSIDWDISQIEKQGYEHFMLKEIFEQPETIQNASAGRILPEDGTVKLGGLQSSLSDIDSIRRIMLIACGTAWHAAMIGEYMLENYAEIPVEVDYASEFRYRNAVIEEGTAVFVISQSGETADTLAALREAKERGARVYGIVNIVGSTIARETDAGIYIHAGPEIGVASTKAFTSQVVSLALLTLFLGRRRSISREKGLEILDALKKLPEQVRSILKKNNEISLIAEKYFQHKNALYLGRSYNFPVALEGALKLKEISYIHAEGYPAAEMKHGPIALIDEDMPVVVIASRCGIYDKLISNIQEVKARKGKIIIIANEGDDEISRFADDIIYVPQTIDLLSPVLNVIPLQLLAYHIAVKRGCNVDMPRNLAKSVTVE
ncbi:MAG: glutamine--fructose-6-phosphate aminotransferase [Spirochaetes bacterium GWF1_41_5]|nr:MAG: glutamine--fructose-6-phosphate aminotransferase [Spirochaetes bacterium GWF1_41_5]HBE04317.1 glutamine--fructose-6-phosphate transaminase (isomerizing) [Spirochaetia bacterium]